NRKGRATYEPNSLRLGPREDPLAGYVSFAAPPVEGPRARLRPESFADHYSQARLFYRSQSEIEQQHIADALIFELGKCEMTELRSRMVAHLLNIDDTLAGDVAAGLGLRQMPDPATPARDLPPSPALSMMSRAPCSFTGRPLVILLDDGFDRDLLGEMEALVQEEGGRIRTICMVVGGTQAGDGSLVRGDHALRSGKSVLFDAVAVLSGADGADVLARHPVAVAFLTDAHNHGKFIGHHGANALFAAAGLAVGDEGHIDLGEKGGPRQFLEKCRALRLWARLSALPREADMAAMTPPP
ncbi:MAG: catalase HPII, partial [Rhodobacteraceae bacterium]|nr:catalase HPII [Paracoccaceae bacterium]